MKENKYDDERFFVKYSEMDRSQKGLEGAGSGQSCRSCCLRLTKSVSWIWDADTAGTVFMQHKMGPSLCLALISQKGCWLKPGERTLIPK